jgi:hypothetical protein
LGLSVGAWLRVGVLSLAQLTLWYHIQKCTWYKHNDLYQVHSPFQEVPSTFRHFPRNISTAIPDLPHFHPLLFHSPLLLRYNKRMRFYRWERLLDGDSN